jgi:putative cell wall-binding protein
MKSIKFTILTILLFSIILISNVKPAYAAPVNKRLWGNDRYGTCSAIVQDGWLGNSEYAVIVNGENFPDALSASTLAKKYNAPILLTQSNALNDNAYNQLKRLNVKQAFIVGGDFVVEPVVEQTIKSMGIQTTRYEGNDRDETSVKVAEQIGTDNGIILTTDSDFTDALSVSSIAAKLQIPIILMPKDRVPNSVKSFISGKNISKTYVLGDNNVINDSVVSQFPNVQRITGEDKFQRNINIINAFLNEFNFNTIYLAYSENFPDALSGSAIAALNGNPIILIGNSSSDVSSNFIRNKLNLINQINILGGTAGIKDDELNTILNNKTGLIGKYWSGCYYATQGKTALTLTINNISDDGTISDALFEFGPLEENPGVPNGSYQMSGKMNKIDNTCNGQAFL